MGAQPVGEVAQQEQLAKRDAELEQAEVVQRHAQAVGVFALEIGRELHRLIIRDQRRRAAFVDPLQQPVVEAVEA